MNFWGLFNFGYNTSSWFAPSFLFKPNYNFLPFDLFNTSTFRFPNIFDLIGTKKNSEAVIPIEEVQVQPPVHREPKSVTIVNTVTPPIETKKKSVSKETHTKTKQVGSNKTVAVSSKAISSAQRNIQQKSDNLKISGYNAEAGKRLAQTALQKAVGWTGYCAKFVKKAIRDCGLGAYILGHAFQMPSILRKNANFKELSPSSVDVNKLPAGCILVYGKGVSGYSKQYGHVEITTGDGRAVSDGITKNLRKKPTAIFMPVEHNYLA